MGGWAGGRAVAGGGAGDVKARRTGRAAVAEDAGDGDDRHELRQLTWTKQATPNADSKKSTAQTAFRTGGGVTFHSVPVTYHA